MSPAAAALRANFRQCSKSFELITRHTRFVRGPSLTSDHFGLHLITPECDLWWGNGHKSPFDLDPFWAIYWPGGQAMSKFVLERPEIVRDRRVLDLGAGSGACAMAAARSGARSVCVNDIDPMALQAAFLNFRDNGLLAKVEVEFSGRDYLADGGDVDLVSDFDVLLVGDMYFDDDLGDRVARVTNNFVTNSDKESKAKSAWVGDPGRWFLKTKMNREKSNLSCEAIFPLPESVKSENNGLTDGFVYKVLGSK